MLNNKPKKLTAEEKAFLIPKNSLHRQYEALRAFFMDKIPSAKVAKRFRYSPGSFRILCCNFRKNLNRSFFQKSNKGPQASPKKDVVRERVINLRKQNYSVYDIHRELPLSFFSKTDRDFF